MSTDPLEAIRAQAGDMLAEDKYSGRAAVLLGLVGLALEERDRLRTALVLYADEANWRRMPLNHDDETRVDVWVNVWYAPIAGWEPAQEALLGAIP